MSDHGTDERSALRLGKKQSQQSAIVHGSRFVIHRIERVASAWTVPSLNCRAIYMPLFCSAEALSLI